MKTLNRFIIEKLKITKDIKKYHYHPKDFNELRSLIEQLLDERGPNADLNDIDVSDITSFGDIINSGKNKGMKGLFYGLDPHNIDISNWDVSNIKNMHRMFVDCENFDCDLSWWDVSNVEDMRWMFSHCTKFKGECLENWNVSNVRKMEGIFVDCENFDPNLSKWNVSNVEDMRYMFDGCKQFTGKGLENWNVSNVKSMVYIFDDCDSLKNKPSWYKE